MLRLISIFLISVYSISAFPSESIFFNGQVAYLQPPSDCSNVSTKSSKDEKDYTFTCNLNMVSEEGQLILTYAYTAKWSTTFSFTGKDWHWVIRPPLNYDAKVTYIADNFKKDMRVIDAYVVPYISVIDDQHYKITIDGGFYLQAADHRSTTGYPAYAEINLWAGDPGFEGTVHWGLREMESENLLITDSNNTD